MALDIKHFIALWNSGNKEQTVKDIHLLPVNYGSAIAAHLMSLFCTANRWRDGTELLELLSLEPKYEFLVGEPLDFYLAAEQWERDTQYLSNMSRTMEHPSAQKIKNMGQKIISYALGRIQRAHGWIWFMLMDELVDDPPKIPNKMRGKFYDIGGLWIDWGRKHGYFDKN